MSSAKSTIKALLALVYFSLLASNECIEFKTKDSDFARQRRMTIDHIDATMAKQLSKTYASYKNDIFTYKKLIFSRDQIINRFYIHVKILIFKLI